ncbi:unnamed protein product [Arabis nemorensis]|uniref:Uncharacterized protein n=1 Tax=Arabis nemorensis TaxID=586526 RepID=A0A565BHF0_9BRAS|nr:unnamed protein product [Arabis nemorensis]
MNLLCTMLKKKKDICLGFFNKKRRRRISLLTYLEDPIDGTDKKQKGSNVESTHQPEAQGT